MEKHAVLIQTHKPINYFVELAKSQPTVNFYVHLDKKCDAASLKMDTSLANMFFITQRVSVNWGGFSQIQATLKLFEIAFSNADNHYFHLISGEDVLLQDFAIIEKQWQAQNFVTMLNCEIVPKYAYRFIMNSPHADSEWQRKITGKIMTKVQQGLAKITNYEQPIYFGSQWFSIKRENWAVILPHIDAYCQFFKRKLVPDEHFFQTLIKQQTNLPIANDNKRFIVFDKAVNNGNSPVYLDLFQLSQAKLEGYWFARKVQQDVAMKWLESYP